MRAQRLLILVLLALFVHLGTGAAAEEIEGLFGNLAFDHFDRQTMWVFSFDGIFRVDVGAQHEVSPFEVGDVNVSGGTVRPSDGYVFVADNIAGGHLRLFDRTGTPIAIWNVSCDGTIDYIRDLAADHDDPSLVYAVGEAKSSSASVFVLDLSDTSGGPEVPSSCQVVETFAGPESLSRPFRSISYDPCNEGFWLIGFSLGETVLVDDDGTFTTVRQTLAGSSSNGQREGIAPQADGSDPLRLWVGDSFFRTTTILDSGSPGCPVFEDDFEDGDTSAWSSSRTDGAAWGALAPHSGAGLDSRSAL